MFDMFFFSRAVSRAVSDGIGVDGYRTNDDIGRRFESLGVYKDLLYSIKGFFAVYQTPENGILQVQGGMLRVGEEKLRLKVQ